MTSGTAAAHRHSDFVTIPHFGILRRLSESAKIRAVFQI